MAGWSFANRAHLLFHQRSCPFSSIAAYARRCSSSLHTRAACIHPISRRPSCSRRCVCLLLCRPQAEQPFSESTLAYIAALDADRDIATLAAHGITLRPECERVFRACTLTLQKGAAAGLTPSQIAGILCREGLTKSVIEKLHSNAMHLAKASTANVRAAVTQSAYLQKLGALLDEYLEDYLLECADLLY